MPWAFFDEASQQDQPLFRGGGILYLSDKHYFKFSPRFGEGTNNYVELHTFKIILPLCLGKMMT